MTQRHEETVAMDDLTAESRGLLESVMRHGELSVQHHGRELGQLLFRPYVLEGKVVPTSPARDNDASVPDGVTVVATTMRLSATARQRLSDEFGEGYIVVDFHEAPERTDVLLAPPVSPRLVGSFQAMFPHARLIITEIEDEKLGVSYQGPVGRLLDAGASAYIPPRPMREIAASVHRHLTQADSAAIEGGDEERPAITP